LCSPGKGRSVIAGVVDGVAIQFLLEPELTDWDRVLARLKRVVSTILDLPQAGSGC